LKTARALEQRVLLLRHYTAGAGEGVVELHHPELVGDPEEDVLVNPVQGVHHQGEPEDSLQKVVPACDTLQ
jgi:hypothetical protein